MKKQKESDLQKGIIDYLRYKGFVVVKFSSVGIWNKKTNAYIPQRQRGVADILACSSGKFKGQFIALECKVGKNLPTAEQEAFIDSVNKNGGIGRVVYAIDEVILLFE